MQALASADVLARSLLAGEQSAVAAHARIATTLGRNWRWLKPLAIRYIEAFADGTRPRHRQVVEFLLDDRGFKTAYRKYRHEISIAHWLAEPQRMQPAEAARAWNLPVIETVGDLAAWLSLEIAELEWLTELKGLGNKLGRPKLQHYHYRIMAKRSGGFRITESPKTRLKALQRRVLAEILDRVPAHAAVHGFVKGRSTRTFAAPHVNQPVILKLDLEDFFPATPRARVQALFRTFGYPESVADLLGGICANAVPQSAVRAVPYESRTLYLSPHLPQGAPTSPALANLIAYRLDCRLTGLAKSAGAIYTRYADDLAFSGGEEFRRGVKRFAAHAAAIASEEGFSVNHRKTRILRRGVRQQLAGIVVNQKPGVPRKDLELLEAILTNCVRFGPESQNRAGHPNFRAHLEGRIGYVEMIDRAKGHRLRRLFEGISWGP